MKLFVISFVIMGVLAELPRFRSARLRFQRQELAPSTTDSSVESTTDSASGPYPPSGWRPTGAQFSLPQETTVTPTDTYGPPAESGPYPPSGWKPEGQAFTLPQNMIPPAASYGTPDNSYGVPENSYGPPSTDATTTDKSQVEKLADTYGPPAKSGPYPPSGWKPEGQAFTLPQNMIPPAASFGTPDSSYGVPENSYGPPSTDATTTDKSQVEKLAGPVEVAKSVGTYYVLLPNGQLQRVELVTENDIQNMKYTARLQLRERAPLYVIAP